MHPHTRLAGRGIFRRAVRAPQISRTSCKWAKATAVSSKPEVEVRPGTFEGYWQWNGHSIRYQHSGSSGVPVVLVHGFGGNSDHWRKNTGVLGEKHRTYAIDLLGYGYSSKPDPRLHPRNSLYCFETWGLQLVDFIEQVVGGEGAFIICNSVGGLAGLQAALYAPEKVRGVQLINISLRGLHTQRLGPLRAPLVAAFQRLLRDTPLGAAFFGSVATPETVAKILGQAYGVKEAVTPELVDAILKPGLQEGALEVFLDFISYSGGPLPEEQLAKVKVPVSILWGEADPWEDVNLGAAFGELAAVEEFVRLPGIGHCPQDEAPEVVNPLVERFILRHSS